ncbi:Mor transcription activator family protein [Gynuella sp.]|uniref:Mor transcription activator family protein n=1 Tax=Gynuella sp. TaxID=2969146 RepID=UPI003D112448
MAKRSEFLTDLTTHSTELLKRLGCGDEIARKNAEALASTMAERWSGMQLNIQKTDSAIHRAIKAEFTGENAAELAQKYGFSERTILKISDQKKQIQYDATELKFARWAMSLAIAEFPSLKKVKPEAWAADFRKLINDGHTLREIEDLWIWCRQHPFWHSQIQSLAKFRKKNEAGVTYWDYLTSQRNSPPPNQQQQNREEVRRKIMDIYDTNW